MRAFTKLLFSFVKDTTFFEIHGVVDLKRTCYKEVYSCNIYLCINCKKKQLQIYNIKAS